MKIFVSELEENVPEGFRKLHHEELINDYLSMDMDNNFLVSKNEWLLAFIKLLSNDIEALEKEGPDSLLKKIMDLSDEFDHYDLDGNKYLEYDEYKRIVDNNFYISE